MMDSIQGFILAGGASSRMGTDKSLLVLNGKTILESIAERLSRVTESVTLIGGPGRAGQKTAPDVYPKWGALGGLHAALANCTAEWALVTACDLPFVTEALFRRFADLRADFEAVAAIQEDGFPQPLCALYKVDPCLTTSVNLIESGERRPIELLNSVKTRWVSFEELSDLNGASKFFANINTPEDYARAKQVGPGAATD